MKFSKFLIGIAAAMTIAGVASAQTVGIGTTRGGATAQVSAGIAKIVSENAGMQMRPQPMGGTQQYIPIVNAGELEFGIANIIQTSMAVKGVGLSEGQPNPNLRMVANMMIFRAGLLVRKDSDIKSVADLKGKRVPSEYSASPLFGFMLGAMLHNGGLTWDDVRKVPVTGLVPGLNALKEGKIDVVIAAVGSAPVTELNTTVPGGVRYIPMDDSPAGTKRLTDLAPGSFIADVAPGPAAVGVLEPTPIMSFDYSLWANKDVSDDIVYRVAKAMYENEAGLKELSPLWRSHSSKTMAKQHGIDFHPGAIKFYQEAGIWK